MLKKSWLIVLVLLFVLILVVGCSGSGVTSEQNDKPSETSNGTEEIVDNVPDNASDAGGAFGNYLDDKEGAASVLPEHWMAFPGSVVSSDWHAMGIVKYPTWILVAPPGTEREEVVEYYIKVADERDDFDTLEVFHGITGTWVWNDVEIMIETDEFHDDPDLVQITFAFQGEYQ